MENKIELTVDILKGTALLSINGKQYQFATPIYIDDVDLDVKWNHILIGDRILMSTGILEGGDTVNRIYIGGRSFYNGSEELWDVVESFYKSN